MDFFRYVTTYDPCISRYPSSLGKWDLTPFPPVSPFPRSKNQFDAVETMHQWVAGELRKDKNTAVFKEYTDTMKKTYWKKVAEYPGARELFAGFENNPKALANLAENGKPAPSFIFSPGQNIQLHHLRPKDKKLFPALAGDWDNILPLPRDIHINTFRNGGVTKERFRSIAIPELTLDE